MTEPFIRDIEGKRFAFRVRRCMKPGDVAHVLVSKLDEEGQSLWTARVDLIGMWERSHGVFHHHVPMPGDAPPPSSPEEIDEAERAVTLFYNKCRKLWVHEHRGTVLENHFEHEDHSAPHYRSRLQTDRLSKRLSKSDRGRLRDIE